MRVIAPLKFSAGTRMLQVKPTLAQDPLKMQYRSTNKDPASAEKVGIFRAWDEQEGAWPLSTQQRGILVEISRRIDSEWVKAVLVPFIDTSNKRSEPSLRLLDWFVTNYSKSNATTIRGVSIHVDYVDVRRAYQCRHFDPFRRNLKITFAIGDETYSTTVGQLNFLVWADSMFVLDYVRQHQKSIDKDMCNVCRRTRLLRKLYQQTGARRKRSALSTNKDVRCRILHTNQTINLSHINVRA